MSLNAKRIKLRPVKAWADMKQLNGETVWGVEVDAKELTFDGHYICLVLGDDLQKSHELAQVIVDAINGRRLPKVNA